MSRVPTFDVDAERLTVFRVGDEYLFSHYFEREDVFEALEPYYDREAYRFAVPEAAFDEVEAVLADARYEPVVVEDLEPHCVVIDRYDEHAAILRQSVVSWTRRGHRFFLMESELAVEEALERGASPVSETEFAVGL